ncbi:MAG: squalene/phytoene synthase family protein [Bacteroidales bacterium]|nr:squalene/phytoene synthase family protein [Bacteroidales bacterium]MDD3430939.1 squalene/phytoene synthase family protein [Bacteroidales bacterium]MDD4361843.1 squalene/phytoene synthase family protein [Bacteroidales bacterium]MDD4429919.1 squalene/phytoene synthase family protein [Bacteroidales bacterium]
MDALKNHFIARCNSLDFEHITDHPNILIAAAFWEEERYQAAITCYKMMRTIDDLVDNYKSEHPIITLQEKEQLMTEVNKWLGEIEEQSSDNAMVQEVSQTFQRFGIPVWTMRAFAQAMIYDIKHDGFPSLQTFLTYAEGASVAPASIFVHLAGLRKKDNIYLPPLFDVREAANSCAVFSYLVHIMRDFIKDQRNNLMYYADDLMQKHGLNRDMLQQMSHGDPLCQGFRNMMADYCEIAEQYRIKTHDTLQRIKPLMEPASQLSLDIIFNLYLMVYERIDCKKGTFSTKELNPTAAEIKKRVLETIQKNNFIN